MERKKKTGRVSPDQPPLFITQSTISSYQMEDSDEVARAQVANAYRGPNKLNTSQTSVKR